MGHAYQQSLERIRSATTEGDEDACDESRSGLQVRIYATLDRLLPGGRGMSMEEQEDIPRFEAAGLCHVCKHRSGVRSCAAFDEIPMKILIGDISHTTPYAGDGGVVFSRRFE